MKQLTEEQLLGNWKKLLQLVEDTFEGERKERLLEMYEFFEDRMVVAPASGKEEYHYYMQPHPITLRQLPLSFSLPPELLPSDMPRMHHVQLYNLKD